MHYQDPRRGIHTVKGSFLLRIMYYSIITTYVKPQLPRGCALSQILAKSQILSGLERMQWYSVHIHSK